MEITTITVFFEGPGLVGKRSAVEAIGRQFGVEAGPNREVRVKTQINGATFDFELVPAAWGLSRLNDTPELFEKRRIEAARQVAQASVIVFVVDSLVDRMPANDAAFDDLRRDLERHGKSIESAPIIFLLNRRDMPVGVIAAAEDLKRRFTSPLCAHLETVACSGHGLEQFLPTVVELFNRSKSILVR